MTDDDDKEVVAEACTSIADIMKDYGYGVVEPCKYGFVLLSTAHCLKQFSE